MLLVLATAVGLGVFVWTSRGPSDEERFRGEMSAICRKMFPAMRAAPDLETALARSSDVRFRLHQLAAPEKHQYAFYNFVAALEQAEAHARSGNWAAVRRADVAKRHYAAELGLTEACSGGES